MSFEGRHTLGDFLGAGLGSFQFDELCFEFALSINQFGLQV